MFVSFQFIVFLILLLAVYYIVPKRIQWILLLISSFGFYFVAGRFYPVFVLVTAFTVYITGLLIEKHDLILEEYNRKIKSGEIEKPSREEKKAYKDGINKKKKSLLILCLIVNLGILAVCKYTGFAVDNINAILTAAGKGTITFEGFMVPMGISFYTFQAVGYLVDVYWGKIKPQHNFFKFTLFVSFFPQLIQGPISRYDDLSKTLYSEHSFDKKQFVFGLERILWGYFKKLVVADRISVALVMLKSDPDYYTGGFVFVAMMFYAAQLYADFTGGIDITIGIAQALGIKVQENFIRPYFSKNIAEYWRRWHVSMGTWFRDYVFYPLSLSRPVKAITSFSKKKLGMKVSRRIAVYIATILTWLATGIWHGAQWFFVVWGLLNGVIILLSEEFTPLYAKFHEKFPKLTAGTAYRGFQVIRTFMLMSCLRLFDIYGSVRLTFRQFFHMFTKIGARSVTVQELLDLGLSAGDYIVFICAVVLMFVVSMCGRSVSVRERIYKKPYIVRYALVVVLLFAVLLFGAYGAEFDSQQFIYNKF